MTKWIYGLHELSSASNDLVGKKSANLGELTKGGFPIPSGFALSLTAYEKFMKETPAAEEIGRYLQGFSGDPNDPADMAKYETASRTIREIVECKAMPGDLEDGIAKYYQDLCQKTGIRDVPVAARSAGPASHPGQYETYLHITGTSDLVKNVIKVWSSTFNQRSLIRRARLGLPLQYDPIGVCVVAMVNAKAAGVMFTLNALNDDLSKIIIEGNWGLGESVVSGLVIPDRWMVDKVTFEIIEKVVSPKALEHIIDPRDNKPFLSDIPAERQRIPCLSDEEVLEISKIGKAIERHFGRAQDIEWAVDMNRSFPKNIIILQARPVKIGGKDQAKPVFGAGKTSLDFLLEIATQGKL